MRGAELRGDEITRPARYRGVVGIEDQELPVTAPALNLRSVARRTAWGLVDQALSSVTNVAVLVVAARSLTRSEFGAIAIALAVYALVIGIMRAVAGEPLTVCYSTAPVARTSEAARGALATAAAVGMAGGMVSAAAGVAIGGSVGTALLVTAVVLPGLVVQDAGRFVAFTMGRPRVACEGDAVWLGSLVVLVALMATTTIPLALLTWGVAGNVAAAAVIARLRIVPTMSRVGQWLRDHQHLWPRFAAEFATTAAGWQSAPLLLGVVAGLGSVGALRAGLVLVGPLNVLFLAVPLVAIPESSRLWRAGRGHPASHGIALSAGLAAAAVAWGGLLALLPSSVGRDLLGSSWIGAKAVVVPLVIATAAIGVNLGSLCALRVLGAARESLAVRVVSAPLVVVGVGIGGALDGAIGAAWALAGVALLGIPLWLRAVKQASKRPIMRPVIRDGSQMDSAGARP